MAVRVLRSSSAYNATLIGNVLIDCGLTPTECIKETGDLPKALLLTHEHGDHTRHFEKWKHLCKIYATKGTFDALGFKNGNIIKDRMIYDIADCRVAVFASHHESAIQPVYFVIKNNDDLILFSTDNKKVDPFKLKFTEVLIEANFSMEKLLASNLPEERKERNLTHCDFSGAKNILKMLDLSACKKITLLHVSSDFGEPERYIQEIKNEFGIETCIGGEKKGRF